jgi:hypothetical protein
MALAVTLMEEKKNSSEVDKMIMWPLTEVVPS